jgi:hypothetical protein
MQRTGNNHDVSSLVSSVLPSLHFHVLAVVVHHAAPAAHSGPALRLSWVPRSLLAFTLAWAFALGVLISAASFAGIWQSPHGDRGLGLPLCVADVHVLRHVALLMFQPRHRVRQRDHTSLRLGFAGTNFFHGQP